MTTEIIGLLIILGALVYVILRHQILPDSEKSKPREAEEATDKLRRQMENSADQIIARMEAHTERLERLVREADEKSRKLDEQMTAARTLEKSAAIMMAAHEIESVKTRAPQNDDFGNLLNETLDKTENQGNDDWSASGYRVPTNSTARKRVEPKTYALPDLLPADKLPEKPKEEPRLGPEVIVSPSVADVVDLPMKPEEELDVVAPENFELTYEPRNDDYKEPDDTYYEQEYIADDGQEELYEEDEEDYGEAAEFEPMYAPVVEGYAPVDMSQATYEQESYDEIDDEASNNDADDYYDDSDMSYSDDDGEYMQEQEDEPEDEELLPEIEFEDETEEEHEESAESERVAHALQVESSSAAMRVREMLDEGKTPTEISREIQLGRGAIELIRQMYKKADTL